MADPFTHLRWKLYGDMLYCRLYENTVAALWRDGLISGEMHGVWEADQPDTRTVVGPGTGNS